MPLRLSRAQLLRDATHAAGRVAPIELFFDLVYVLAVTQVTHHLVEHLTLRGAFETLVLLLAIWLAWIHIAWSADYFDLDRRLLRLLLLGVMLASLVMSSAIPHAFDDRGLVFTAAFLTVTAGETFVLIAVIGTGHHLGAVFERVAFWWAIVGPLWLVGALVEGDARLAVWISALVIAYGTMWFGFPVPTLGRNRTTDYTIAGEHLAERAYLFITIALGESILVTGSQFGLLPASVEATVSFGVAFIGVVAVGWLYFDRMEAAAMGVIASAADPGRLGIIAYTYFHLPMVLGIILYAAAVELTLAHPGQPVDLAAGAVTLVGPAAYIGGNALFKSVVWGHLPPSRPVALLALLALVPLALVSSRLVLLAAATAVAVGVAIWDWREYAAMSDDEALLAIGGESEANTATAQATPAATSSSDAAR